MKALHLIAREREEQEPDQQYSVIEDRTPNRKERVTSMLTFSSLRQRPPEDRGPYLPVVLPGLTASSDVNN
jgi:hypothetical protein